MMTFEDQLFTDLMEEHGSALQHLERPTAAARTRRFPVRRAAWLTGVATAGGVAAGVALLGASAPAYAVTQHPDGTVTVSIARQAGVKPANAKLRVLGDPVVVVPVGAGCPSITSLPKPAVPSHGAVTVRGSISGGAITVDAHGIPAGETMIIAYTSLPNGGSQLAGGLTSGPIPSCVSLPSPPPSGPGHSGGASGTS